MQFHRKPPCGVLILVLLLAFSVKIYAQDEPTAVPNRPTVSTTAQPVEPGVLETEWGVNAASSHQDINGLFKFGVSKNFELRFANNPLTADSGTHGVGDTGIGFKYRLTQDSGIRPSVALMYMSKIPTAGDVLGSGEVDHAFNLLVSKDIRTHHFDFNLIANLLGRPQGGFDRSYLNALAWSHQLHGKWGATAEISGTTSPNRFRSGSAQLIASGTYTPRPRLVVDFGMMGRITGDIPDAALVAGFTFSISDFYRGRLRRD